MTPPPRDPKGSSSDDLALARRLSQNLTSSRPARPAPSAPGYVKFSAVPAVPPVIAPAAPPAPPFRAPRLTGVGKDPWTKLLAEVKAFTQALGVFVIDEGGLMVASTDGAARETIEGVGSRLVIALEHADLMTEHRSRSVAVDLGDRVLTGLRVRAADGSAVTMGVATKSPLSEQTRNALYQLLPENLPRPSAPPLPAEPA